MYRKVSAFCAAMPGYRRAGKSCLYSATQTNSLLRSYAIDIFVQAQFFCQQIHMLVLLTIYADQLISGIEHLSSTVSSHVFHVPAGEPDGRRGDPRIEYISLAGTVQVSRGLIAYGRGLTEPTLYSDWTWRHWFLQQGMRSGGCLTKGDCTGVRA